MKQPSHPSVTAAPLVHHFYRRAIALVTLILVLSGASLRAQTTVATPHFVPDAGDAAVQFNVAITCATSGASIYYTTDGSDPTEASVPVPGNGNVLIGRHLTLKARAYASGMAASAIKSADFRVTGSIFAGGMHGMGLKSDGTLWSWGEQNSGRLGNGETSTANITTPQAVTKTGAVAFDNAIAAAGGLAFTLAVDATGKVWAFGDNADGQLGINSTVDKSRGERVIKADVSYPPANESDYLSGIAFVAAGLYHSLAAESGTGKVWGWGERAHGRIGDGYNSTASSNRRWAVPVQTAEGGNPQLTGAVQLAAAKPTSYALRNPDAEGRCQVWAWGNNASGELCQNAMTPARTGYALKAKKSDGGDLNDVIDIAAGYNHAAVIRKAGAGSQTAWCWGERLSGRLGNGGPTTTANIPYPVQVVKTAGGNLGGTGADAVIQVSAGPRHTLALTADGYVWAWGANGDYQRGDAATTTARSTASKVKLASGSDLGGPSNPIVAIAAGGKEIYDANNTITDVPSFSLALALDGTIYGWGFNGNGECANGSAGGTEQYATASPFAVKLSNQKPSITNLNAVGALTAPASIFFRATTTDPDSAGTVTGLTFFQPDFPNVLEFGIPLPPHYFDSPLLPPLGVGSYSFSAIAVDAFGEASIEYPVVISVITN